MTSVLSPAAGRLGATALGDGRTRFEVWAPAASSVEVVFDNEVVRLAAGEDQTPIAPQAGTAGTRARNVEGGGLYGGVVDQVPPGTRYRYRLHREGHTSVDRPDPASRWQPEGVHGPSAVDDPGAFVWNDAGFSSPPIAEQILYELHLGTFSPEGTFDGAIDQLAHLVDLGVTTIELMPVWQFPGDRNWGYDGVLPSAVQDSYGGPEGLRRLVDAAHARGLGVILDVVHNHLGPEGNHLADFGPYTTDRYTTPWGPAINVDGPGADQVRRWIVESVVGYVRDHHLDGFRLDAVHGIIDTSATHLLEELAAAVHAEGERQGKRVHVIAETDRCDPRVVRSTERGGYGLDAQWGDDLHHAVHVALTGERDGYYLDHTGLPDLLRMFRDRYAYAGRYSVYRQRTIGRAAPDLPYDRFVVCVQNHDQVGNRMLGDRLHTLTDHAGARFAAALLLTSPFVPMLFMGEEYGEPAPFQYFVSHTEPELIEGVRTGRRAEFADFADQGPAPDPQDPATFERSKLDVALAERPGRHATMFAFHQHLIRLRSEVPLLADPAAPDPVVVTVPGRPQTLAWQRRRGGDAVVVVANAETSPVTIEVPDAAGSWQVVFDSAAAHWRADTAAAADPGASPPSAGQETGRDIVTACEDDVLRVEVPERTVRVLSTVPDVADSGRGRLNEGVLDEPRR